MASIKKETRKRFSSSEGRRNESDRNDRNDEEAKRNFNPVRNHDEDNQRGFAGNNKLKEGVKLIGKAASSFMNKGFGVKKVEEVDPAHYKMLASEDEGPPMGHNQDDGKKRVWTKDGAILVDKPSEYDYMKTQDRI